MERTLTLRCVSAADLRAHGEALAQADDAQLQRVNTWGDALIHCFGVTDSD